MSRISFASNALEETPASSRQLTSSPSHPSSQPPSQPPSELAPVLSPVLLSLFAKDSGPVGQFLQDPQNAGDLEKLLSTPLAGAPAPLAHLALFFNRFESLHLLLGASRPAVFAVDAQGCNLMHLVMLHNKAAALPFISRTLDLKDPQLSDLLCGRDLVGRNILHKAVTGNSAAVLQAMYELCLKAQPLLLRALLRERTDEEQDGGMTPLHYAALRADLNFLSLLLKVIQESHEADPADADHSVTAAEVLNARLSSSGLTPLHLAVISDRTPVIKLLVEHGASLAALDQHGLSPVHYAARQNNLETLGFLMSKIDALPPQVSGQMSVLHYLCSNGNSVALEQLLASPKCNHLALTKSASGDTPLHLAAWFGHRDCVALLIAHLKKNHPEADIEASCTNFAKATPAHFAAYRGNTEVLQLLDQAGFHMDAKDEEASTPLHKACAQGSAGCVGFLLGLQEVSAKVSSAADMHGFTPLHLAVLHDHAPILRTLLQAGASPNVPNLASFTPFHLALMRSSPTILGMLTRESLPEFQGNAMCDALASELKLTMLHLACSAPSRDTMQFLYDLLPQYCAPNPRDAEDRTPLHYAFLFGRKDLIPLLLMHSADASLVDKAGNDATAKSPFPPEEVAELLSHGNSLKRTQVQKKWRAIAVTFNQSPKAGVEEGVTRNLMERTPLSIAQFLYECEHLKKEMIGEYIGDHKPFHIEVLDAYAGLFSFEGLPFDAALRLYLSKFRLPGEAQKIERCVERFARQFHAQNPGSFRHEDGAFILSYSTIMLNTDAHNPQVKNKMTKEQFVKTNRGIDDGQDIPQDFLERLYDSITGEAIKMDGEGELRLFQAAEKKGWMRKQGGRVKTWKRRWFVLSANCVYYFKFPEDKEPLGIIPLENLDVRPVNVKKCEFEIFSPQKLAQNTGSESAIKAVKSTSGKKGMEKGHHDRYLLSAANQEEMDAWIACIRSHIVGNPVYLLMQQRAKPKVASQPASSPPPTSPSPPDAAASSSSAAPPASHSTPTGTAVGTLPPDIAEFDISFREIHSAVLGWYHLQINSIDQLRKVFADWDVVFETSSPDISLAICTNHASRQQSVIFHRAAWDDIDVFAQVLHTAKVVDPRLYEIGKVSEHLVNSILSRHLKYDYALSLIGDGLGGCHAIEVWASIRKQLKVQPKIITFGQPLHSFNIPSKSLKTIPLVRFLTDVDPVVYLFSGVDPYGGEIILMKQGLFSVITRPSRPKVPASLTIERAKERAQAHIPREYLARVEQLLHKPTRVQVEK